MELICPKDCRYINDCPFEDKGNCPNQIRVIKNDKSCKKCVDYMNCFMNQVGIGSGNFGKECSFYDPLKL